MDSLKNISTRRTKSCKLSQIQLSLNHVRVFHFANGKYMSMTDININNIAYKYTRQYIIALKVIICTSIIINVISGEYL